MYAAAEGATTCATEQLHRAVQLVACARSHRLVADSPNNAKTNSPNHPHASPITPQLSLVPRARYMVEICVTVHTVALLCMRRFRGVPGRDRSKPQSARVLQCGREATWAPIPHGRRYRDNARRLAGIPILDSAAPKLALHHCAEGKRGSCANPDGTQLPANGRTRRR